MEIYLIPTLNKQIQFTPLVDKFRRNLRDLRISVTDRCNFRCPYCMPADIYGERYEFIPKPQILTFEEIARLARIFNGVGAVKFRITGGEPLVRADIHKLISILAGTLGNSDLALTTNGFLLEQMAEKMKNAGLQRITVSIDSIDPEVFRKMNGLRHGPERTLKGIEAAIRVGLSPVKLNVVAQRGVNDHTLVETARYFKGTGCIVRFIEFMDVGNLNKWSMEKVVTAEEILNRIDAVFPLKPAPPEYPGEVGTRFLYADGTGEVGVISSVSKPFCKDCTRARLTTDGHLVTCLFASKGTDLKTPMRQGASDDDLRAIIERVWKTREDRYSELRSFGEHNRKLEMYQLGG